MGCFFRMISILLYGQNRNTMDTKLTLKLDQEIIERAKTYAKENNTSLSKLIESYLSLLVFSKNEEEVGPVVKSISGVMELPEDYDAQKEYKKHLIKKYSK